MCASCAVGVCSQAIARFEIGNTYLHMYGTHMHPVIGMIFTLWVMHVLFV